MTEKQKGFSSIIVLALISILVLVILGYFFVKLSSKSNNIPSVNILKVNASNPPVETQKLATTASSPVNSIIKILDNKISNSPDFVEGAAAPCQPDFFDPKTTKFKKIEWDGSPSPLYAVPGFMGGQGVMMIDGWNKEGENKVILPAPFSLTAYDFGCASSLSYVLDLTKNSQRQALYTQVINWSASTGKPYLYLVNNLKTAGGKWRLLKRIIDITNNKAIKLPNMDCVDQGVWDGDRLITYSDENQASLEQRQSGYQTQVCVWSTEGNLLYKLEGNLDWYGASKDALWSRIGFLPKDQNIFYAYKTDTRTDPPQCVIYLQDLTDQNRWKVQSLFTRNNASGLIMCPQNINFDFTNTTFVSPNIKFDNINSD